MAKFFPFSSRALFLRKNVLGKLVFQIFLVIFIHIWLFFVTPWVTQRYTIMNLNFIPHLLQNDGNNKNHSYNNKNDFSAIVLWMFSLVLSFFYVLNAFFPSSPTTENSRRTCPLNCCILPSAFTSPSLPIKYVRVIPPEFWAIFSPRSTTTWIYSCLKGKSEPKKPQLPFLCVCYNNQWQLIAIE